MSTRRNGKEGNEHFGGAAGNSSVNLNLIRKYPPLYGVPSKPQINRLRESLELAWMNASL